MNARRVTALVLGLLAVLLAVFGVAVVWGLAVDYGRGTDLLLPAVVLPTAFAAIALLLWPGLSGRVQLFVPLAIAAGLLLASLGAEQLGLREREQRTLESSASFGCNNTNSEVFVDESIEETWAALPRPAPLYGPIEGTPDACTAGVSGDPADGFDAWAVALRDLEGWRVLRDDDDLVAVRRDDGMTVVLARGDVTTLRVSTRAGTVLRQTSGEFVTGPNRTRG
jgi:hypothetical protein